MKLRVEIELDNMAFEDDGVGEVERLLIDIASRVPDPLTETNGDLILHDSNGNWVGFARIEPGEIRGKR